MSVQGKAVFITGASRGLGRALAEAFLKAGARVYAQGRDLDALAETVATLKAIGGLFDVMRFDVRNETAVCEAIGGLPRLDALINNAGIARVRPFLETPTEELREVLEVNVIGAFVVMREAAKKMLETGGGHVINIASDAATRGIGNMAPYVASKHGLLGISRSVSLELRQRGIRVTTFCPGPITTEILGPSSANPKYLAPSRLAETIVHLAGLPPEIEVQELLVQPVIR